MLNVKKVGNSLFAQQLIKKLAAILSFRGRRLQTELELPVFDEMITKYIIVLTVGVIVYGGLLSLNDFGFLLDEIRASKLGSVYIFAVRMFLGLNLCVFLWRILLVLKYKPVESCSDKKLPRCTVIVPAYNEGKGVLMTLESVVQSDYPAEKLQIIAVDDGSSDDTFEWIKTACGVIPGRIESVQFAKNQGKRAAIFEGVVRSKGQIIVTIDSDSVIEPQTLRRLVSPFVSDKSVGAVAGNVRVLNCSEGIIPKMLDVIFAYSFDFLRVSQSMVDTVFCTPGALSAYRKDVILKNLNVWLNQTFLGTKANIGEDRALTNMIIDDGWSVRFQSNSFVYTMVPTAYVKLCKMFMRWARSNVRETLAMGRFIFRKFRNDSMSGARINFIMSCINLVIPQTIVGLLIGLIFMQPQTYLSQIMLGTVLASTAPAFFYVLQKKNSDALWAYAYGLFWFVGLWWITPWSVLTARNGNWLTRQLPKGKSISPVGSIVRFRFEAAA
ncbi:MAG: glycosyltransferase [Sedimentisphaerales bacterium]